MRIRCPGVPNKGRGGVGWCLPFAVMAVLLVAAPLKGQSFTKITTGPVVNDGGLSFGGCWEDYDGDGWVDLLVVNWGNNFLYRNNGDSTFTRIVTGPVPNDGANSRGASWGDYDNDGFPDLFVANAYGENNRLYHNNGDGTFTQILSGAIVSDGGTSFSCSWVDYDQDGFLDMFVANFGPNFLYRNNGDGTFTKITTGALVSHNSNSLGCSWADYDNDGDPDVFLANAGNNDLFTNNGDGTFTRVTGGPVVNDGQNSLAGAWGDLDNDGDLDLFVANYGTNNALYLNNGDGTFTQVTSGVVVNDLGRSQGCMWEDFDNDGDVDLFVSNDAQENSFLYQNQGDGTFIKVTQGVIVNDGGPSFGCSSADFNRDGFRDVFVANMVDNNFLYLNDGNANHWLTVKLRGSAGHTNVSAIGARVRLKATIGGVPVWQMREVSANAGGSYAAQSSMELAFGLGDATTVDSLLIRWTTGREQVLTGIGADQFLDIEEDTVVVGIPASKGEAPRDFVLYPNYPNPFNPVTNVEFGLPNVQWVTLKIYDLLGREVKTLVNQRLSAGRHTVQWDGTNDAGQPVGSGVYLYRLTVGQAAGLSFVQTRKMVLLR